MAEGNRIWETIREYLPVLVGRELNKGKSTKSHDRRWEKLMLNEESAYN